MKTRSRHLGISLIESLISTAIIGFGLMSLTRFQTVLIQDTGYSREHTTAIQLTETTFDLFRSFETISPQHGYRSFLDDIVSGNDTLVLGQTTFTRHWTVDAHDQPARFKTVVVEVGWEDARGVLRQVNSASLIAANDPRLLGSHGNTSQPMGVPLRYQDRHHDIPVTAVDQGDGTSHFSPPGTGPDSHIPVIVFDNTSGDILGVFSDVETPGQGEDPVAPPPEPTAYFLLFGYIGFDSTHPATSIGPNSAIDLRLVDFAGIPLSGHFCWDDSTTPNALRTFPDYISYTCLVPANGLARVGNADRSVWSGQAQLMLDQATLPPFGWGLTAGNAQVCRYSATPPAYDDIHMTRGDQNYVVTRGDRACPPGTHAFLPNI